MGELEVAALKALIESTPAIGRWIAGLIAGDDVDPSATRRVAEILPERGASDDAADTLRYGAPS